MLEQIRVDLKKNYKSSFFYVIFIALVLILLPTFFINLKSTNKVFHQKLMTVVSEASTVNQQRLLEYKEDEVKNAEGIKLETQRRTYFQNILMEISSNDYDFAKINQANLDYAKFNLAEFEAGRGATILPIAYPQKDTAINQLSLQKNVSWYTYLVKHNLNEYLPGYFQAPAVNYLNNTLLYTTSSLLILFFFALQLAQVFTTEKRQGTIQLLNNLPQPKLKVLTSKLISAVILIVPAFLVALLSVFALNTKYGSGKWDYPVQFVTNTHVIKIITMRHFMLLYLATIMLALLFLASFSAFVSLFSGNFGLILLAAVAPLLITLSGILQKGGLADLSAYLPFSYLDVSRALTNTTAWSVGSFGHGALVLIAWSLLFYLASYVVLRKRQHL